MWINLVFTIFFTLYFINMILITNVTLCSNPYAEYSPFPYTLSPPPYIFPELSSFLCLKCTMYIFLSAILIRL